MNPRSPSKVSSPFLNASRSLLKSHEFIAILYRSGSKVRPISMLSLILPARIQGSSEAKAIAPRIPSSPDGMLNSPRIPINREVLPLPTGPTTATNSPGKMSSVISRRHSFTSFGDSIRPTVKLLISLYFCWDSRQEKLTSFMEIEYWIAHSIALGLCSFNIKI